MGEEPKSDVRDVMDGVKLPQTGLRERNRIDVPGHLWVTFGTHVDNSHTRAVAERTV